MQDALMEQQAGCLLVYLVLQKVRPRSRPSSSHDSAGTVVVHAHQFEPGQMIAVDAVLKQRVDGDVNYSPGCSWLRLADGSGWVPTNAAMATGGNGVENVATSLVPTVQQVGGVEFGMWPFYVDNSPVGIALRRHPMDASSSFILAAANGGNRSIVYEPMRKIYCDRKVIHPQTGVQFYRVQGTNGWVFDRRAHLPMLIDVSRVKRGIFCFQALTDVVVQRNCSTRIEASTPVLVKKGRCVAVDVVRTSDTDGEGPFLRLTDGSGWLCARVEGVDMMKEVPVERGVWELKVLNLPVGVSLRRHPMDSRTKIYNKVYPSGSLIQADCHVKTNDFSRTGEGNEISFFRVRGTNGWVFERRGEVPVLEVLTDQDDSCSVVSTTSTEAGWTPEFVRGVAATIEHIYETDCSPSGEVVTFETSDDIRILVYCSTHTVGVQPNSGGPFVWYRNCSTKQLWDHLRKDLVELMVSGNAANGQEGDSDGDECAPENVQKEEELRKDLLKLEKEIEDAMRKRSALLEKIAPFDRERTEAAQEMRELARDRAEENEEFVRAAEQESEEEKITIIKDISKERDDNTIIKPSGGGSTEVQLISSTDDSSVCSQSDDSYTLPDDDVTDEQDSAASCALPPDNFDKNNGTYRVAAKFRRQKRKEVRSRIQQLLQLKSMETVDYAGAAPESLTLDDNETHVGDATTFDGDVADRTLAEDTTFAENMTFTFDL